MNQLLSTIDMPMTLPAIDDIQSLAADGVYLVHGWGSARLEGTPYRDVLEAQTKGLKTMAGGAGDDVYLLNGQWAIEEKAGEGFDWAVGGGGWAITLPENVEAYWNNSTETMRHLTGNAGDNVLIGGGSGEKIDGRDGDDFLYGGGSGGDTFFGGAGSDTVGFFGKFADYQITDNGSSLSVADAQGGIDTVMADAEFLQFADRTLSYEDAADGIDEPVAEEPVAEEPVAEEPVAEEPVAEEPVAEEPVAEEPVAEEPVAEEPVAEEPVVTDSVAKLFNPAYDDIRPSGSERYLEVGEGKTFVTVQEAFKARADSDHSGS